MNPGMNGSTAGCPMCIILQIHLILLRVLRLTGIMVPMRVSRCGPITPCSRIISTGMLADGASRFIFSREQRFIFGVTTGRELRSMAEKLKKNGTEFTAGPRPIPLPVASMYSRNTTRHVRRPLAMIHPEK